MHVCHVSQGTSTRTLTKTPQLSGLSTNALSAYVAVHRSAVHHPAQSMVLQGCRNSCTFDLKAAYLL